MELIKTFEVETGYTHSLSKPVKRYEVEVEVCFTFDQIDETGRIEEDLEPALEGCIIKNTTALYHNEDCQFLPLKKEFLQLVEETVKYWIDHDKDAESEIFSKLKSEIDSNELEYQLSKREY